MLTESHNWEEFTKYRKCKYCGHRELKPDNFRQTLIYGLGYVVLLLLMGYVLFMVFNG